MTDGTGILVDPLDVAKVLVFMNAMEDQLVYGMTEDGRARFAKLITETTPVTHRLRDLVLPDEWREAHAWAHELFSKI